MNNTIHPDIELGEVKIKVSDLARSLTFYQEVVGLKVLKQTAQWAEMTADGENTLLILEEVPNAIIVPERTVSGLYHFAILLPTRKDLGLSLRRLVEKGIHVGQADHLVSEALYISDPDQNGIEIYCDRPREAWQYDAQDYIRMATEPIDWEGVLEEAKDHSWEGMPPGTRIGHVHFHVGDIRKSKEFYCDRLGFSIEADYMRQMGALFIAAGKYHHHIGLNIWAGVGAPPAPPNAAGIAYFTIVMPSEEELDKTLNRLKSAGIAVDEQAGAWFANDPSGITVKLRV